MEKKIFRIRSITPCGGSVKVFVLFPEDGKNISFSPGQFATLHQLEGENFGKLSRPYSISSSPLDAGLRFMIKITGGQFTSMLDKMKEGELLGVMGPFGHFAYSGGNDVVCIAAGTGVAPMLGILEHVSKTGLRGRFTLFYSNKKQEWVAGRQILDLLEKANSDIKVVYTLTQEQPEGWKHELGRINSEMVKKHAPYAPSAKVFICGPMEFAKSMKEIALGLGASQKDVISEAWG